jgi:hypothetical protein
VQWKRAKPLVGLALLLIQELPDELIFRYDQDIGEHGLKSSFLILVVQHDDGSDPQGMPTGTARGHFSLQILQKPVGEVILIVGAPRCFHPRFSAVRTIVLDHIFLRIAVQRRPTRVTDPQCFLRMKTHDD